MLVVGSLADADGRRILALLQCTLWSGSSLVLDYDYDASGARGLMLTRRIGSCGLYFLTMYWMNKIGAFAAGCTVMK